MRRQAERWIGGLVLLTALMSGCESLQTPEDKVREQRDRQARQRAENNEKQLGFKAVIKGRVTYPSGRPAAGVFVFARFRMHQTGMPGENEGLTGPDGRYEIRGLSEQDFMVQPRNDSAPIVPPPARRVSVKGTVSGIDFVVEEGPWLTIRLLEAETGNPIPGIPIRGSVYDSFARLDLGTTDAKGELKVQLRTVQASFAIEPPGGGSDVTEAPGFPFFRNLTLKPATKNEWIVRAYRGGLYKDATFRGRVVDVHGRPVEGAKVTMFRYEPQTAVSDHQGRFSFRARRLTRFGETEGGRKLAFRAEKEGVFGEIYPTAEETWAEMKLPVAAGVRPSLTGQVVDFDGAPQAFVPICFYEWMSNVGSLQPCDGGYTDRNGFFDIRDLSPGARYSLRFGGYPQYRGGILGYGVRTVPERNKGPMELGSHERRNLGRITLPRGDQKISGVVVDREGKPARDRLMVVVRGQFTDVFAYPDASGRFLLENVVREGLTLWVFRGDGNGFRTDDGSQDQVHKQPVRAGDEGLRIVISEPIRK